MAGYNHEKYFWLKLKDDFFKRHDIKIIKAMPNGIEYVLFYLNLLLESVSHDGRLRFSDTIPYNEQMLSVVTDTNIDIVRSAMNVFQQLNLVEILDDETIYMRETERLIGSTTISAEKKQEQFRRREQELLLEKQGGKKVENFPPEIEIDIDKEKCISKDIHKEKVKNDVNFEEIIGQFNEICTDLPKVVTISDARKQLIKARYEKYGMELLITVFQKAHASDFLSGRLKESGHFKASFDWLMKPGNFAKVLDGNYDNRTNQKEQNKPGFDLDEFFENATKKRG